MNRPWLLRSLDISIGSPRPNAGEGWGDAEYLSAKSARKFRSGWGSQDTSEKPTLCVRLPHPMNASQTLILCHVGVGN